MSVESLFYFIYIFFIIIIRTHPESHTKKKEARANELIIMIGAAAAVASVSQVAPSVERVNESDTARSSCPTTVLTHRDVVQLECTAFGGV